MTITVENLAIDRGARRILSGVSFSCEAGQSMILRGPNGSGKTTLLRVLAGFAHSSAGSISNAFGDPAYLGHTDALKGQLTVEENLYFWAGVYGRAGFDDVLDALDLQKLRTRLVHRLSAGQKRRTSLARMLISGASLWLLDEPTTALDTETVNRVENILSDHITKGGAVILSTHLPLSLANSTELDISRFLPKDTLTSDPFLEGSFA